MYNKDLIRFIMDLAAELIGKAETASPKLARGYVDEAEELLSLGAVLLTHRSGDELLMKEAA